MAWQAGSYQCESTYMSCVIRDLFIRFGCVHSGLEHNLMCSILSTFVYTITICCKILYLHEKQQCLFSTPVISSPSKLRLWWSCHCCLKLWPDLAPFDDVTLCPYTGAHSWRGAGRPYTSHHWRWLRCRHSLRHDRCGISSQRTVSPPGGMHDNLRDRMDYSTQQLVDANTN